jgi:catechol 2,3-dioxygenase-like lactoylglutathione lyase family enzyme
MAGYALNYLALVARDVDAACRFLGGSLGLRRTNVPLEGRSIPFFGIGKSAVAVFEIDDPYLDAPSFPGVHHMALGAEDPSATAAHHELPVAGEGVGPDGKRYVAINKSATVGIRTRFIEPLAIPAAEGPAYKIDHLGIASNDNDGGICVFVDNLGCPLESTQTDIEIRNVTESFISDKYGAVYHARPPEILGGLRDVFITIGDCELEFLMDYDPAMKPKDRLGEEEGNTKGDQSAIAKFVERRGPGLAHVAFATKDIDAILPKLAADGWRMIDLVGRPGGRGSKIGFVHPSNFGGGLLIHFVQPQAA